MPQTAKARVFMSGRSQHVTIPAEYRFRSTQVSVRRDPQSGDLILREVPDLEEVFAVLDATKDERVLDKADRDRRPPQVWPALEVLINEAPKSGKKYL
jgi:virulence-associated protein VagC